MYVLSGGGYTRLFNEWMTARFAGRVECSAIGAFVSVELLKCRGVAGAPSDPPRGLPQ
jgi:hypothetical protein